MKIEGLILRTPPSVNHYVKHTRSGRHYKTPEAETFMQMVAIAFRGLTLPKARYGVTINFWLGKGERLDVDNAPKCCLDALVRCGAIASDSYVDELHVYKKRDRANPRTYICASSL
jgi:crossover junction endodeoxyribonuclease RusA